jgi:hypothetical protein
LKPTIQFVGYTTDSEQEKQTQDLDSKELEGGCRGMGVIRTGIGGIGIND